MQRCGTAGRRFANSADAYSQAERHSAKKRHACVSPAHAEVKGFEFAGGHGEAVHSGRPGRSECRSPW